MIKPITRRESLLAGLFGSGYIGLRALATGLPAWFLLNPRRATAQDLQCMLAAANNKQFLVLSTSSNGDPINCNAPGTYEATDIIHPTVDSEMQATTIQVGGQTLGAPLPWADPSVMGTTSSTTLGKIPTGQFPSTLLARTCFFHHQTGTVVHGDQPKVMKVMGSTSGGEMMVSAFAKHLAICFGTVRTEPIAVGAGSNGGEFVSFAGRTLPSISPQQLKQLLTGSTTDPLVKLQAQRDTDLDSMNALIKSQYAAGSVQAQFLDALASSQTQLRTTANQIGTALANIKGNDVTSQTWAAAALIAAKVTPVVTMHIPFGGDNHSDNNLQAESDQYYTGVGAINALFTNLASLPGTLADQVSFATMNVFGRNLSGISKVTSRTGRDHWGNHNVMVMVGKNFKSSVVGGVLADSSGGYAANGINPSTGLGSASGGIMAGDTLVAAARTLGAGLGIPDSVQAADWANGGPSGTAVTVTAALATIPAAAS
jgi:hypothetical protein